MYKRQFKKSGHNFKAISAIKHLQELLIKPLYFPVDSLVFLISLKLGGNFNLLFKFKLFALNDNLK